ncbi:response regulator transcription factor [Paraburkholderia sp. Ac-20336]|uniref:response regulator transcription factor n=1 Tax=Burkholderiaceae TaxID=119060 RepID=UPI001422AA15|nr:MULTISPECIES: response regulator transcription factor [Burkholderiaceae]MBN3804392.1 response regulator transcription factor [Paraburkholderia sp. Ac-20336]MBN3847189.1 response regulator transcription factor [Paraburkholderia sp. Ac-20342]NIF50614.1 response regulator transcription factor [Burkholderia sp. Ax-1724]NIF79514.1 response regulator transcription factor [Paraburkholderia sp. Cy-641]
MSTGKSRILVVEDDDGAALEITAALEDHGFQVEWVATGFEGLLQATNGKFDAIVLDRMLPDVDGLSILATLRNIGKQMPVLILSALDAVDERVRGLRTGGDDYMVKPFNWLELTARLNALLRRRRMSDDTAVAGSALRVDDLTVDPAAGTVRRAGHPVELKPREYSLLLFLMRHAGDVVTRRMLLESVWHYHSSTQTNVIDMHICSLRRKISLEGRLSPMIVTVRNTGYILHAFG